LAVSSVSVVSLPGLPLIPLIYSSQVVNAVLLPLHVVALALISRSERIMGEYRATTMSQMAAWGSIVLILACVGALVVSWF